jgi:zinc protease
VLAGWLAATPGLAQEPETLAAPGGALERWRLPGGPTVVLQPVPNLSAAAVCLALPGGSRMDPSGQAGLTHLLEHIVFRSTPHFDAGRLPLALEQVGARAGAQTTRQDLLFWELVPAGSLDLALRIQADRLAGLNFTVEDLEREKALLIQELADSGQAETRLTEGLRRALWPDRAGDFRPPGGLARQVAGLQSAHLREAYQTLVRRERAVLVVVGGFEARAVRARLAELFPATEEPPAAGPPAPPALLEPEEEEPPLEVEGSPALVLAFPAPGPGQQDFAAVAMLDAQVKARLRRALGSGVETSLDPEEGLYLVRLPLAPQARPSEVESLAFRELDRLRLDIPESEVGAARLQALAGFYRSYQDLAWRARTMARRQLEEGLEGWLALPERLRQVGASGMMQAAGRYLRRERAAVGQVRNAASVPPAPPPAPGAQAQLPSARGAAEPAPAGGEAPFRRVELDNGLVVLVWTAPELPLVALRGYLEGGSLLDPPGKEGLTWLAADLLGRGTRRHPGALFAAALQEQGMELAFRGERQAVLVEGWTLSEQFPRFAELLGEALRQPELAPEECDRARHRARAALEARARDIQSRALDELLARMYGGAYPGARPPEGTLEGLQACGQGDIAALARRLVRPDRLVLAFSGRVTEEEVLRALRPQLGSWWPEEERQATTLPPPAEPAVGVTELPGRPGEALVLAGHPGPSRGDADWYAFNLLNQVLGGNPLSSRLALRLRDVEGLAPWVESRLLPGPGPNPWVVGMRVHPDQVPRALEILRSEMERLRAAPPAAEEMERARGVLSGRLALACAEPGGRADLLINLEFHRLSPSYARDFAGIYRHISAQELLDTARSRLHPEGLVVVVARP